MKTTTKKRVEVNLKMNDSEARWLKAYMQNYMDMEEIGTIEGDKHREMRENFFNTLKDGLEE